MSTTTTAVMPRLDRYVDVPAPRTSGLCVFFLRVPLRERIRGRLNELQVSAISVGESLLKCCVIAVLLSLAGLVIFRTTWDLLSAKQSLAGSIPDAVSGALCAIIIIDVLRTVVPKGLQLPAFIKIGMISAVREILSAGAHLSLLSKEGPRAHLALTELKVNMAVLVGLAVALFLTRFLAAKSDAASEED